MAKKKFYIQLARLVREVAYVTVEAESEGDIDVGDVYDDYEEDDWEPDIAWGCEPGTHHVEEIKDGEESK